MSDFKLIDLKPERIENLCLWLKSQENIFSFSSDNDSSLLICYVLSKEIGGPNDDLARFIYDEDQKKKVNRKDLTSTIGIYANQLCVRIQCIGSKQLRVTIPDLCQVVTVEGDSIYIFPHHIARHIQRQGLTPVFVRDWVSHIAFSAFDPKTDPLLDQLGVLKNNDTFIYAKVVANRQVIFQGMHDIVGHITGIESAGFKFASEVAGNVFKKLHSYFGDRGRGNLPSHLTPFLIGLILDDLTQKPFYFSTSRAQAIQELLRALDYCGIGPKDLVMLKGFPKKLNDLLQMTRDETRFSVDAFKEEIQKLLHESRSLITEVAA
jgi:hypothetical protein